MLEYGIFMAFQPIEISMSLTRIECNPFRVNIQYSHTGKYNVHIVQGVIILFGYEHVLCERSSIMIKTSNQITIFSIFAVC